MNTFEKPSSDGTYMEFVKDVLEDRNHDVRFLKRLLVGLLCVCIILAAGLIFVSMYGQRLLKEAKSESEDKLYNFISQYDFETSIDLDTGRIVTSESSGNINFNQR